MSNETRAKVCQIERGGAELLTGMSGATSARARAVPLCAGVLLAVACNADPGPGRLVINELMSDNDGAWVDERGETEDFIELVNAGGTALDLHGYSLLDASGARATLPELRLQPGRAVVLAADNTPEQGPLHLPFKLSSQGDSLQLQDDTGSVLDEVEIPALEINEAFARLPNADGAFVRCRYASPARDNGQECGPPVPPELADDATFAPFAWPDPWPEMTGPLVLSELALKPARFVEVLNASDRPVALADYAVRLHAHAPGLAWPGPGDGVELAWPAGAEQLAPGERVALEVADADVAAIAADEAFEGVATIFAGSGAVIDRIDFERWPAGAALTRVPDASGHPRFCAALSAGAPNERCDPLPSRDVGDRVRHFYTPGDFAALAAGDTSATLQGVKFVIDLQAGGVVHLLSSRSWALHYTFIREKIDLQPPLDRCDPLQSLDFNQGWYDFSQREYFRVLGRRYLLGTLNRHASGLETVEYALGDQIIGEQMLQGFFSVMQHVEDPHEWVMRPSEPRQVTELTRMDGQAPIVGQNAPFQGVRYQPLTEAVGYGVLRFVPAAELANAALGSDVILVTDDVPNDIALVGGLITEAFQTPLAHVNVLSKNRGTPNMALRDARDDPELAPLFGELVRLEVNATGFSLAPAIAEEADAFWQARRPHGERIAPRLDLSVRNIQPLYARNLSDLPSIGAKAAQFAELMRVNSSTNCGEDVPVPPDAFAIPVVHYVEHFIQSGAAALLQMHMQRPEFRADPALRAEGLAQVQQAILSAPVDPELLAKITTAIQERFGEKRVRLRSSSNTEDLPLFNGAGLYTSVSAAIGDPERPIDDGLRTVWASLWSLRAYDERELGNIDQTQVAMGVLVQEAFLSERANAVAISRNVLDPTRADIHYINAQIGEASVANPAPGVATEQLIHYWRFVLGTPRVEYQSKSSLAAGQDVLTLDEIKRISCQLAAIHEHFRQRIDPLGKNRWFAVDIELKLVGDERRLVIKQARPYSFGSADVPLDCRET